MKLENRISRKLQIRVTPRSSTNSIIRWKDGVLSVRLTAPPVEGAANSALCEFVAELLKVGKQRVQVSRGEKSRIKELLIEDFDGQWPWED